MTEGGGRARSALCGICEKQQGARAGAAASECHAKDGKLGSSRRKVAKRRESRDGVANRRFRGGKSRATSLERAEFGHHLQCPWYGALLR